MRDYKVYFTPEKPMPEGGRVCRLVRAENAEAAKAKVDKAYLVVDAALQYP